MNAAALVDTATELAYLVRLETPAEVRRVVTHDIHPDDKDALLILLAALVDIDRTRAQHIRAIETSPTLGNVLDRLTDRLTDAAIASYEPEHTAYLYGDRDPEVVARARAYATAHSTTEAQWSG